MEEVVLAKLRELVGWSSGDGIFSPGTCTACPRPCPPPVTPGGGLSPPPAVTQVSSSPSAGGSISNMYAMNVARFHRFPESRQKGNWALPRLALFASQEVGRGRGLGTGFGICVFPPLPI